MEFRVSIKLSRVILWIEKNVSLFEKLVSEKKMEYGYSILMGIFAGVLFLYGLITFLSGDILLVARNWAAKISDKKRYARQFGKVIMIISTAPLLSALLALFGSFMIIPAVIVLIGGIIGGIVIGIHIMPKEEE